MMNQDQQTKILFQDLMYSIPLLSTSALFLMLTQMELLEMKVRAELDKRRKQEQERGQTNIFDAPSKIV